MTSVVKEVCGRWEAFLDGDGQRQKPCFDYEYLNGVPAGTRFAPVLERGQYARLKLAHQALLDRRAPDAFLSLITSHEGQPPLKATIGKLLLSSSFPVLKLYDLLNTEERRLGNPICLPGELPGTEPNCWGGSDTHGGSPLRTGSWLQLGMLTELINAV